MLHVCVRCSLATPSISPLRTSLWVLLASEDPGHPEASVVSNLARVVAKARARSCVNSVPYVTPYISSPVSPCQKWKSNAGVVIHPLLLPPLGVQTFVCGLCLFVCLHYNLRDLFSWTSDSVF